MLLPLVQALLKADQTPDLDGFFLAKLEVTPVPAGLPPPGLRWRRFPGGQRGAVIARAFGDRLLTALLLEPQKGLVETPPPELPHPPAGVVAWLRFTTADVDAFVRESGDENANHRGPDAVVPGLLLATATERALADRGVGFGAFRFRFRESLPVGRAVGLLRRPDGVWAGCRDDGRVVFTLTLMDWS
jgi:hypothetical protein